jgi:hypothetical protein
MLRNVSLLFLVFSSVLFAQSASIGGQVLNSGEAAVPGAAVTLLTQTPRYL